MAEGPMSKTGPRETRTSARWKMAVLREAPLSGELSERLRWFIFLRWGAVLGTLLGAVMSRFLSLVSHELRSPLAAMRTWLESILVSQDDLTPESRRALERCSIRSQGLLTLTKELLELSKQRDLSQTVKRFKITGAGDFR